MNAEHFVQSSTAAKTAGAQGGYTGITAKTRWRHDDAGRLIPVRACVAAGNRLFSHRVNAGADFEPGGMRPPTMKSLARHLYIVVHSIEPNGLGALSVAAFAALMIGILRVRQLARAIIRCWAARF